MRRTVAALALVLAACAGDVGPMGPEGPTGPAGPGTRLTYIGQLDSQGTAEVVLPVEAGSVDDPPAITCAISSLPQGPFMVVATDVTGGGPICTYGMLDGTFRAGIGGATPGWYYQIVVVF